jgi:hypothetical protein
MFVRNANRVQVAPAVELQWLRQLEILRLDDAD